MAFKYRFQHFMDIQSSAASLTMISIRAGGTYAMQRCKHLWGAFKYAKLGAVSVKFLPMSTLPVDPAHMSYDSEDPYDVNPVDMANPGLIRITNGENIFRDISSLSDDAVKEMYINTMLDPRWSKFMLQRGFSRRAVPLYYTVGNLQQTSYPDAYSNLPVIEEQTGKVLETTSMYVNGRGTTDGTSANIRNYQNVGDSDPRGLFQTGHKGRLGWMPTDGIWTGYDDAGNYGECAIENPLPSVDLMTVILPKAEKTEYFYRVYITETVWFSGIKNTGINDSLGREYRAFDNFTQVKAPFPIMPDNVSQGSSGISGQPMFGYPTTKNDGDSS